MHRLLMLWDVGGRHYENTVEIGELEQVLSGGAGPKWWVLSGGQEEKVILAGRNACKGKEFEM